ncbi:hypothetical protein CBW65_22530 [Tumebacillus avium]|uniref:HTH cro/C1-type domain-containing protein n=1 Tax=Tumebacillus avium TaxID=1903704 RepID=A0A1Y0IVU3_9BACL|nr:helix-turn-helix transcriptional regulator [Tumebacillus avium]ARU63464.1 hypothetical protein CBW65_22530 [Tumebacillus avium]
MKDNQTETLGEKIRRLRLEKGMSQGELADGFVTVSMISQIERDKNTASIELLRHIARKLQVQLHELVRDEVDQMELYNRHKLAKIYLETHQPEQAEPHLLYLKQQSDLSYADQLEVAIDHAECMIQQGMYESAIELLTPTVTELETNLFDDVHTLARMRNKIGNAHFLRNEFTLAYYNYQKAYDRIERFSAYDQLAAFISYNLGRTLRLLGQYKQAGAYIESAQGYFQSNQDVRRVADTLFANAQVYYEAMDQKRAAELYQQAHVLYTGLNLISMAVKVQHNVAVFLIEDKDRALRELNECAEFYLRDNDYTNYLLVLSKKAELLLDQNLEEAEAMLTLAEELINRQSLQETEEYVYYLRINAKYFLHCKRYADSLSCALKSAIIYARMGVIAEQVDSLEVAVDAYRESGDLVSALDLERERNKLMAQLYRKEAVR